jgi:hypothetical protein
MKQRLVFIIAVIAVLSIARGAGAMEMSLESRNFKAMRVVVYKVPTDCSSYIKDDDTLVHTRKYIEDKVGPFITVMNYDELPHLAVQVDCLKLVDTRGEGRVIGYTLSIMLHFYRPFFEDLTYVHASTWNKTDLVYIPAEKFMQADFEELLDPMLDEFCRLWLDEHRALSETDDKVINGR